jgi:hypothetical protein
MEAEMGAEMGAVMALLKRNHWALTIPTEQRRQPLLV